MLWESNTICRYLAGKPAATTCCRATALARARVEQWMDWQAGELNNAWRYAFMGLVRHSPAHQDAAAVAASARAGTATWASSSDQLSAPAATPPAPRSRSPTSGWACRSTAGS